MRIVLKKKTDGRFSNFFDFQEVFRRDWMFKLVGDDVFELDGLRCILRVRNFHQRNSFIFLSGSVSNYR